MRQRDGVISEAIYYVCHPCTSSLWSPGPKQQMLYTSLTSVHSNLEHGLAILREGFSTRVLTQPGKPGKPGKMRVHLENLEISWNFEKFNKYHGKMT